MHKTVVLQLALVFVVGCMGAVKATPSSTSARYTDTSSELLERYPAAFDDESSYHTIWDTITASSGEDEEALEEQETEGLDKRDLKTCRFDFQCPRTRYCSTKRNKCYLKVGIKKGCSRDGACSSGYCGRRSKKCSSKKSNGLRCFQSDLACSSGYCSPVTKRCSRQRDNGESCTVDKACRSTHCTNGKCTRRIHTATPEPTPEPSGSP